MPFRICKLSNFSEDLPAGLFANKIFGVGLIRNDFEIMKNKKIGKILPKIQFFQFHILEDDLADLKIKGLLDSEKLKAENFNKFSAIVH